jgi:hypothetical protein
MNAHQRRCEKRAMVRFYEALDKERARQLPYASADWVKIMEDIAVVRAGVKL